MTESRLLARRAFLARIGVLGAALGVGGVLLPGSASGSPPGNLRLPGSPLTDLLGALRPVLAELSRDTLNGLTVFAMPGRDVYSHGQGVVRNGPGAMEAKATDFMIGALDTFVPFPQQVAEPITAAVATGLSDAGIDLNLGSDGLLGQVLALDDALLKLLAAEETIPLSLAVALLLNLVATQVNPRAVNGRFLSPFARLSYAEKARAFALLEGADADLVGLLDTRFPEPLHESVSGLLQFLGGALIEFATFGGYSEWAVLDRRTRRLTGRPAGWRLTDFRTVDVEDGWDELKGYYQDRREVRD